MARIVLDRVGLDLPQPQITITSLFRSWRHGMPRSHPVLQDIDLSIVDGERVGVVGPSGAGKSILLRLLAGRQQPTSGRCAVAGQVTLLADPSDLLDPEASGEENLERLGDDGRAAAFSGLGEALRLPVRYYSTGMRWRLGFAAATARDAEVLLIDGPLGGGDLAFRTRADVRLHEAISRCRVAVMTGHDPTALADLCTRLIWLEGGRVRLDGPVAEVLAQYGHAPAVPAL